MIFGRSLVVKGRLEGRGSFMIPISIFEFIQVFQLIVRYKSPRYNENIIIGNTRPRSAKIRFSDPIA